MNSRRQQAEMPRISAIPQESQIAGETSLKHFIKQHVNAIGKEVKRRSLRKAKALGSEMKLRAIQKAEQIIDRVVQRTPALAQSLKSKAASLKQDSVRAVKNRMREGLRKPKAVVSPGDDQFLIPVPGERHPARIEEAPVLEKTFQQRVEVKFQQENQKAKAFDARRRAKGVYRNYKF